MAASLQDIAEMVRQRLSATAFGHCERVARTAASLAQLYGSDPDAAACAGLLHDWHRETDGAELIARARSAGLRVTSVDEAVPYLLHGPVAAAELAREMPELPQGVTEAIAAHTYGATQMSPLAMIVYVADVIEPDRDHPGVEDLRGVAGTVTLEELFARAYVASVLHLVRTRRHIHPATVDVWNRYVAGGPR